MGIYTRIEDKNNVKILTNEKWLDVVNNQKYVDIRNKIKGTFNQLIFIEEGHKYYLNGKEMSPVSTVTHHFFIPFDSETKAQGCFEKFFNDSNSKYYQMTKDEILKSWVLNSENACERGTDIHAFGESCFYYMIGDFDNILPEFKDRLTNKGFEGRTPEEHAVINFYNDIPKNIIPILAETRVYSEDYCYAGTFDILFYYESGNDETSGLFIMDFKTNSNLYNNFQGEKMLPPFEEMLKQDVNIYKLQLSLYQIPLEDIGYKIVARRLIWIKPEGVYEKVNLEEYTNKLRGALKNV